MTCPACERENPADARFCAGCGAPLARPCPDCGRPAAADAVFCAGCGRRLDRAPPRPPDHIAEMARASREALEGEHKQVTVLFADVKGSMELQEDLDPEDWHGVMDRFMRILADGVHRFEGTVDKFTGDGVMALFGAPVAHEDHARRACYAALHLAETIGRYADELRRTKGLSFHVRIGLNSGEVIVGTIGDDSHMEYTAVGHTVGLARRMEALAEPGRAYLTEQTARLVEGYFRLRDLGGFNVKGARDPVGVSVLEGVGALRGAYDVARSRGLSRLVGRGEEMAALESALARAMTGNGQVVGVVGEPGVGKSRLCGEFTQSCQVRGLTVYRAHGVSHGRRLPLLPAVEFLRQVFAITDADPPQAAREKVAGRLLLYDLLDPASEELPVLFDILEIPDPARPAPQMAPEARLRRLFTLLRRLAGRRSERETVVILLEDLHWFDPASTEFMELLVESYPGTRTLLLTNFRPEFHAEWMRHSYYRQLPLATLDAEAVRELLGELLGTDSSLLELSDRIISRTGGNPFFVEEVVRNLIEEKTLQGGPGAYRLTCGLGDLRVPPTVQSLLSARIDRLAAGDKQVLQTAAVIGRTFSEPVLHRVTRLPADDFGASVRALGAAEFIHQESLYPVVEYRFWHPLTQEVAYGSLLGERRSQLHAAVAGAIAELDPRRADERAPLLAQHWEAAGEPLEAARWHARAAHRAGFRDLVEARRHWEATIRLLTDVPPTHETRELGMNACARLARIAFRLGGDPGQSVALIDRARALAEEREDPFGIGMTTVAKGFVVFGHGRLDDSIELMSQSVGVLEDAGEHEAAISAGALIAYPLAIRGPLTSALRHTDETAEQAVAYPNMGERLFGLPMAEYNQLWRAWLLPHMGRFESARAAAEDTIAAGRKRSLPELVAWGRPVIALIAYLSGGAEGAVDYASESVGIAEELGSAFHSVLALEGLGVAYLAAGRGAEALVPLRDALALASESHVALFEEASLLAYLAEAHRSSGDDAGAVEASEAAVAVARRQHAGVRECQALVAQARALRAGGADARKAVADVVAAAHRAIEDVGAVAWSPFLAEEEAWLAEVTG
ncbi:MAG TPA: adenylate/guanylate cyclase domain-containing protein [Acidimicrobiia bacterium]|nr:adenylate/guanylate cyclase domain-containing protein [Acidimicrobiia bacterium]